MPKQRGRPRIKNHRELTLAEKYGNVPTLSEEMAKAAAGVPQSDEDEQRITAAIYALLPEVRERRSERVNRQMVCGYLKDTYEKRVIRLLEPETERDP